MLGNLTLVTAPATEPVSIAELRTLLRIDVADEDSLLAEIIIAARRECEIHLRRALINQTWDWKLDAFPSWSLYVPLPPLVSVTSIVYLDSGGASITLASTKYKVDTSDEPGRITPEYSEVWPDTRDTINAITIRFVAGYGGSDFNVPSGIRQWILRRAADHYEMRGRLSQGVTISPVPFVDGLLDPYRWGSYA
jgi:uncharacterized phiE125 gp8 family phage protein